LFVASALLTALGDTMVVVIAFILMFWLWGRLRETNQ